MSQRPGSTLMPSVEITSAPRGTVKGADGSDSADTFALDEDDTVSQWSSTEAVDQRAADQRLDRRGLRASGRREHESGCQSCRRQANYGSGLKSMHALPHQWASAARLT